MSANIEHEMRVLKRNGETEHSSKYENNTNTKNTVYTSNESEVCEMCSA